MSLLPKLYNLRPIYERVKEKVKNNFLTTTNTVIGILVGIFTLITYGKEIFGINKEETKPETEVVLKSTNIDTLNQGKQNKEVPTDRIKKESTPKIIKYFNINESLLDNNNIALFIKKSNGNLDLDFQNKLNNLFQNRNILASSSFFNGESLVHYNYFYSANPIWLKNTKIQNYLNKYLIGTIKLNKSVSSEDGDISIINLIFQGKLVNIKTNKSFPIIKEVRETSYQEFRALEDAFNQLSQEIVEVAVDL